MRTETVLETNGRWQKAATPVLHIHREGGLVPARLVGAVQIEVAGIPDVPERIPVPGTAGVDRRKVPAAVIADAEDNGGDAGEEEDGSYNDQKGFHAFKARPGAPKK